MECEHQLKPKLGCSHLMQHCMGLLAQQGVCALSVPAYALTRHLQALEDGGWMAKPEMEPPGWETLATPAMALL